MTKYRITRENLLDGSHHARVRAGQGSHGRFMTDEERRTHVGEILARAPRLKRIWVFGYLFDTAEHLRALRIRDRRMEALARTVRALRPHEKPPSP